MPTKKTTKRKLVKKAGIKKITKKVVVKKTVKKAVRKSTKKTPAKKSVKKTPAKKVVKKSIRKSASNRRDMVLAENDKSFWTTNGQVLNSLVALRDALAEMEKEVYMYHAGGKHNDFANWVDAVLSDSKCAKDLEKAKTPNSAKTVVVRHLKLYSV